MSMRELLKFPGVARCIYISCHVNLMSTIYTSGSCHFFLCIFLSHTTADLLPTNSTVSLLVHSRFSRRSRFLTLPHLSLHSPRRFLASFLDDRRIPSPAQTYRYRWYPARVRFRLAFPLRLLPFCKFPVAHGMGDDFLGRVSNKYVDGGRR